MKTLTILSVFVLMTIGFFPPILLADTTATGAGDQNNTEIKAYLEKKIPGDPDSCMVENMKIQIIGISDLVPGHQAEVFL